MSDQIRWSTDYRLHSGRSAVRQAGKTELDWFYGLKDSLLLRDGTGGASGFVPDWSSWATVERTSVQDKDSGRQKKTSFDPVIVGPWMDLWNLEKGAAAAGGRNPHIDRYMETEAAQRKGGEGYLPDNW